MILLIFFDRGQKWVELVCLQTVLMFLLHSCIAESLKLHQNLKYLNVCCGYFTGSCNGKTNFPAACLKIGVTGIGSIQGACLDAILTCTATDLNSLRIYFTKIFWHYYMTQEKRKEHNHCLSGNIINPNTTKSLLKTQQL